MKRTILALALSLVVPQAAKCQNLWQSYQVGNFTYYQQQPQVTVPVYQPYYYTRPLIVPQVNTFAPFYQSVQTYIQAKQYQQQLQLQKQALAIEQQRLQLEKDRQFQDFMRMIDQGATK